MLLEEAGEGIAMCNMLQSCCCSISVRLHHGAALQNYSEILLNGLCFQGSSIPFYLVEFYQVTVGLSTCG